MDWIRDVQLPAGAVSQADLDLLRITDDPAEVVSIVTEFAKANGNPGVTDLAEPLPGVARRRGPTRRPATCCTSAPRQVLFALNGTVAKTILLTGMDTTRLSQLRVTGAALILVAGVALIRPAALRSAVRSCRCLPHTGSWASRRPFLYSWRSAGCRSASRC